MIIHLSLASSSVTGKFTYLSIPIEDMEGVDLVTQLPKVFTFIEDAFAKG